MFKQWLRKFIHRIYLLLILEHLKVLLREADGLTARKPARSQSESLRQSRASNALLIVVYLTEVCDASAQELCMVWRNEVARYVGRSRGMGH